MKIENVFILILFLSLIVFMGCDKPESESAENSLPVLKSYRVPERLAKEVHETLNTLLFNSGAQIGSAKLSSDGQLLVVAPTSFHEGVEDFIEQLIKTNPEPSPSVEVNYWIVAGRRARMPAKLDEFNRIKPALETIQSNQGNMEFKLLDQVVATSSSQNEAHFEGAVVAITQTVSAFSDGSLAIALNMTLLGTTRGDINSIATDIETKSGEMVLLGQSSQEFLQRPIFEPRKEGEKRHFEKVNVYYIISADVKK